MMNRTGWFTHGNTTTVTSTIRRWSIGTTTSSNSSSSSSNPMMMIRPNNRIIGTVAGRSGDRLTRPEGNHWYSHRCNSRYHHHHQQQHHHHHNHHQVVPRWQSSSSSSSSTDLLQQLIRHQRQATSSSSFLEDERRSHHERDHHHYYYYYNHDSNTEDYQYSTATTSTNPILPPTKYLWDDDQPLPPQNNQHHCPDNPALVEISPQYITKTPPRSSTTAVSNDIVTSTTTSVVPSTPSSRTSRSLPSLSSSSSSSLPLRLRPHHNTPPRISLYKHRTVQQQQMQYHHQHQHRYYHYSSLYSSLPKTTTTITNRITNMSPQHVRIYHTTSVPERSTVALVLGLGAVSVGAYAISSMVTAVKEFQQSKPPPTSTSDSTNTDSSSTTGTNNTDTTTGTNASTDNTTTTNDSTKANKNIFEEWFGIGVNHKYYEGGFEEKMTRREAALILGIRESSTTARIKDAHRKLLILNHPDTGGSTYLTHKINEAKELLLKGRNDK